MGWCAAASSWDMGETTCHCRVIQLVETRVYCHKDKKFALDPIAAFVTVLSHIGPTGVCNLLSNYLGNLFKGESLGVGLGHDALTFTC